MDLGDQPTLSVIARTRSRVRLLHLQVIGRRSLPTDLIWVRLVGEDLLNCRQLHHHGSYTTMPVEQTETALTTVSALAELGPIGLWSMLVWQISRFVTAVQDHVKQLGEHQVDETKHWAAEADHRRLEVERWRESTERGVRQERLLRELVERGADRPRSRRSGPAD